MKRVLLSALLLLVSGVARGEEDLTWLKAPTKACADGAVSTTCKCGGTKVTTGFCCSGVAQAYQCLLAEPANTVAHVYFTGSAIADTKGNSWTMVGTVPQVAASGIMPPGAGPFSDANYYKLDPNANGNDVLDFTGEFTIHLVFKTADDTFRILVANYNAAAAGYWFAETQSAGPRASGSFNNGTNHAYLSSSILPIGRPSIATIGRSGANILATLNGDHTTTTAGGSIVAATANVLKLGRGETANLYFTGTLYEMLAVQATPSASANLAAQLPFVTARASTMVGCLGDSITYGSGSGVTNNWPNVAARLAPSSWLFSDYGVPSTTTTQMLSDWTTQMRAQPFAIVAMLGGVNDVRTDVAAATIESNLQAVYDQAMADGKKVVAISILPFKGEAAYTAGRDAVRVAVNTWIANYVTAHSSSMIFVDAATDFDDGTGALKAAWDCGDHIHPNNAGQTELGTIVYNAMHAAGWL